MNGRTVSWIMFTLLLTGIFISAANIQPVEAEPRTIIVPDDYPTIQAAINAASPGDTIFVCNGTYYENVIVNKAVRLVGEDRSATVIDGKGTGTVLTITANHVMITGFTVQRGGQPRKSGIYLQNVSYCIIAYNNIAGNSYGIELWDGSNDNSIFGNNVTNNDVGMDFDGSFNSVFANSVTANSVRGIALSISASYNCVSGNNITKNGSGIFLDYAFNNSISGNNISNNDCGIEAHSSDFNRICGNNITSNIYIGISLDVADRNLIYHNNFVDNQKHIHFGSAGAQDNIWDDRYPSGGNYWSDYTGIDNYSGPYQNETGSDGIGDTPYIINSNNIDHYPLINPYPPHDIAVVDVVCNRTWVYQGHSISINVTISNKGDYHENVTVTLYYNITANKKIGIETINLLLGENQTITFIWDTTSVEYCHNYTITAVANTASPDAHPLDNTLTDGKVKVRIMGDINDDGIVDMADISIIIEAFLAEPWHPRWNPEADLNQDRITDLADIAITIDHFLEEFTP